MSKRKTHEEFIKEMNIINPNIEILGMYINNNTKILCKCKIDGNEWYTYPSSLLKGHGCIVCSYRRIGELRTLKHDDFIKKLSSINTNIEVLENYVDAHTKIKVRCKTCGNIWYVTPNALLSRKSGCPICSRKNVAKKRTKTQQQFEKEVYDINPNIEIIGKYINNDTPVDCRCKLCNSIFHLRPHSMKCKSSHIYCPVCSDGISYPNKYVRNFLKQLPIKCLEYEWRPEWGKPYIYDNYFIYDGKEYVVEADGEQHYIQGAYSKDIDEIQRRDNEKDKLADKNNVIMIRIDCRNSSPNYIRNSIINSVFADIFELNNIDWNYCNEQATNNFIKIACDLYNRNNKIIDIANELKLDRSTIRKYLKFGKELGWCDYVNRLSTT